MNEILALPSGFRYRNRFDIQWIDSELKQEIESTNNERVLLILRDRDGNTLIPFRWGKLFNVERIGKVILFEYHLQDLIAYNSDENIRREEINARTNLFQEHHPWLPGPAGEQLTDASVFKSRIGLPMPTADANDLTAWGNCISAVTTAPVYARIEFLKIVGLFSANKEAAPIADESYIVKPNAVYQLKVFQHVPVPGTDSIPQHSLTLNTFPGHITALRPTLQAVGKYDMLTFVIKILDLSPGEQTAIEIPDEPDAATTKMATTSLYLPLRIEEAGRGSLVAAVLLALAGLYFMFRPQIASLSPAAVRNVATIVFILTAAGPSKALSSLWPSFPWKFGK